MAFDSPALVDLIYRPDGTEHGDVEVRVGVWRGRCDSYYFALDHPVGTPSHPVASFRGLLEGWVEVLGACSDGQTVHLPFDFSDQYTGWLACRRVADAFEVVPGWSNVEGWSIYPSDREGWDRPLDDFTPFDDAEVLSISVAELVQAVRTSLLRLGHG